MEKINYDAVLWSQAHKKLNVMIVSAIEKTIDITYLQSTGYDEDISFLLDRVLQFCFGIVFVLGVGL